MNTPLVSWMYFLGETRQFYLLLPLYNAILRSCTKNHNLIQATKCLDLVEKKMIGKNEVTYTALLQVCNEVTYHFVIFASQLDAVLITKTPKQ